MAYHFDGKAIFSTRNGEYARRERIPSMRIVLRSSPIEDQQTMVAKLREEFPEVCKAISLPVTDRGIYEYFDYCDAAVQGFEFLRAVLGYIAALNASANAENAVKVRDYVGRWREANTEAFPHIRPYHAVMDLFTEEDIEEHGVDFLTEAMVKIKSLRTQEDDNEARQSALRLQMQHAHMMHNHRSLTHSQAPVQPHFPVNLPPAHGMRAISNPEQGQPQPQGNTVRLLPVPPGQFSASQGRIPLQRLTPSTEMLEHINPGSTSRGDFHSDPTTHNAMNIYSSGFSDNYVAIASRGVPGPFNYRPLPLWTQPVPLQNRKGTFDGSLPRGKRNPKKKSSDDARMVPSPENGPRQPSNGANPKPTFTPQNMHMPSNYRYSPSVQEVRPSLGTVPYSGNNHQPNLPSGHILGSGHEPFHHAAFHGQASTQSTTEAYPSEGAVSNRFSPATLELQESTQGPRPVVPSLSTSTIVQDQIAITDGEIVEENAGLVPTPVQPHISQPLDQHVFGRQPPDRRIDDQHQYHHIAGLQRPVLAPVSNSVQSHFPETPRHLRGNEVARYAMQEGCTIWIGGIPNGIDRARMMDLLRPCRGLVNVSEPRLSSQFRNTIVTSYAFADFQNPVDAAEALERLPQTRFASLPEGSSLRTNYPRPKAYSSPGHHQHGSDRALKWPTSNVSPTKSRKGEECNGQENTKAEHSRKPSRGWTRAKKHSTSSSEGKPGKPSEHVSAGSGDRKESGLQTGEAIVCPGPDGNPELTTHVSQAGKDGLESMPITQDSGAIQPHIGMGTHTTQVSNIVSGGAQDASLAPDSKLQVQENHQATSSRQTEGRTKASKKKSRGSNKVSVSEKKGLEPPTVHATLGGPKAKARANPSVDEAPNLLENSGQMQEQGNQAASEIEAGKLIALAVPSETISTLPKDLQIADQSFLGGNATGDDGKEPKASVAYVTKDCGAKDDNKEVSETAPAPVQPTSSAVLLKQSNEPLSQAMRREISSSTQGSADTDPSIPSYTGPPSSSQTERSNSVSQESFSPRTQTHCPPSETTSTPLILESGQLKDELETSIMRSSASLSGDALISITASEAEEVLRETRPNRSSIIQDIEPGEVVMKHRLETSTSLAPSEAGEGTKLVQIELQNSPKGELEGFQAGLVEENFEKTASVLLIEPSPSKSDRSSLGTPARTRALSIPLRSSSLVAPATPIKTHQKKKPRNLTPVKATSPLRVTGPFIEGTKMDSGLQQTGGTRLDLSVLTIDTTARTPTIVNSRHLPKPETPFLTDDGVRMAPPKISRQVEEASNADQYYAQKKDYQDFHWGNGTQINVSCSLNSSDSELTQLSEKSTPNRASVNERNDVETTLREAGYRSLSGTSPFTIKDPELAFLEKIDEEGKPLENRTNQDKSVLTLLDEKGKIASVMSFDAWAKQQEMVEVVKKATAAKRLLACSPPLPWTKIESQRQQLSRFVTQSVSDALEQQTNTAKAQQVLKAEALLNTIPQRNSSNNHMQRWSRVVSLFMEDNASELRKPGTNSFSNSSRGASSPRQQQGRRHPILINQPDPQSLGRKLERDEDTSRTVNTELNNSHTSGQTTESEPSPSTCGRRTPSEERSTSSVALIPSTALNQVTKLKDLFAEMGEDRRRRSEDLYCFSSPQEEERMTVSNPELQSLDRVSDAGRVAEVEDEVHEQGIKEMESEVQRKPEMDRPQESKGEGLDSDERKEDQIPTVKSELSKNPTSTESKGILPQETESPAHRRQNSQPLEISFLSFESNDTTSNEGIADEVQQIRPRGGHSPIKRSGYNAVASRGIDGRRGGKNETSKDPWALPQGEKPWGNEGVGWGEKKKRRGQ